MNETKGIDELLCEYSEWAVTVRNALQSDVSWVERYKGYAERMLKNEEKFREAKKKFNERAPLHYYLTVGNARSGYVLFDVRYLGQSVGTISVREDEVLLSVTKKQADSSKTFFGYDLGGFEKEKWHPSDGKARQFRDFFKKDEKGIPRQREHMVESALFSELEKKKSENKCMVGIQPIRYAGIRTHMKTALCASKAKNGKVEISKDGGGEIDCLCRRHIKPGESRLVVIEVKDENNRSESFDATMKQAISYAVFLRELIRSDAGEMWKKVWGMEKQYRDNVVIDAVVAMPKEGTKPGYCGERIRLENGNGTYDFIELHYMALTSTVDVSNSEDVTFETSYDC